MKILKYLIGFLLMLLLLFIILGMVRSPISYENQITVDATAQEAWEVMSDDSKMSEWLEGFKRTELVSGEVNTAGAVSHVYVDDRGEEMMMKETITSISKDDHIAMDFTMDFMDMKYRMEFDEADGKTVITSKTEVEGNGMISKSMIALMKGAMKSQEDKNLASLKKLIDEI